MSRYFASLRQRLIIIVLLAVLPALGLTLYTGLEQRRIAASGANRNALRLVHLTAVNLAGVIQQTHDLLATLAERRAIRTRDAASCSSFLAEMLVSHPFYSNIGTVGPQGKIICSARSFSGDIDVSDRDYFQGALKTRGFAVGNYQIGRVTGKACITFGYPVISAGGDVDAVLFAALDLAWLNDLATHVQLPGGSTLTMIDHEGTVVARYPDPEHWIGKRMPETEVIKTILAKKEEGIVEARGVDGDRRLYAYAPFSDVSQPLFLYSGIPVKTVYAEANRLIMRNLIALCAVSAFVLIAARLFGYLFLVRQVDVLVRAAQKLAGGDLSIRAALPSGKGEINQLAQAFNEMAESLERQGSDRDRMEEALRKSEAKFRTLVEQIPAITYIAALDDARTTLYISPQVESLLGYDQEDHKADPDIWRKRLHPDDRERVLAEVAACQAQNGFLIAEYRVLTCNNYVKWFRDEGVVVKNEAGEPLFLQGVMLDITDQKRAEEELRKAHDRLEIRVEERTKEIAEANMELRKEIAERKRVEEELRNSAEKLKRFAYSVVHDLKSPAIGAYGLTKLLQKQYAGAFDQKGRRYCDQILKASENVAELVEKINSYIATKETPSKIEIVNIPEILQMVRDEFSARLGSRRVTWSCPGETIEINADRLAMLRIFRNLVDNALKYGGEQLTEIRIDHEESETLDIFSVSDNGAGIGEEDTDKIFDLFQRHESSKGTEGAGLGLAIVREIAEQHGGQVWMEPGLERGTTFHFSIAKSMQ